MIYFHCNSVLDRAFYRLELVPEVRFPSVRLTVSARPVACANSLF